MVKYELDNAKNEQFENFICRAKVVAPVDENNIKKVTDYCKYTPISVSIYILTDERIYHN